MGLQNSDPYKKSFDFLRQSSTPDSPQSRLNQPYFVDMVTGETLILQMVPLELNYKPETQWNVVASPGRNNPLYQYISGEDTLSFSLSWYANEESREDVLRKCKWLESLSKADGYDGKPHAIKFMFGNLFNDAKWIVFDAGYRMSMFNRSFGMLPALAFQEITLKRITTENSKIAHIRKIDT